jgi:hypothetical protein
MSLFKNLLKAVAKEATTKGGQLLKDMIDPDSEMNRRPNFLGKTRRLDNDIKYEQKKAELERVKYERLVAQNLNETFDQRSQILSDLRALEVREKEIELELKRMPLSEIEAKTKLYEELGKNKDAYNRLLLVKKQIEGLQG